MLYYLKDMSYFDSLFQTRPFMFFSQFRRMLFQLVLSKRRL